VPQNESERIHRRDVLERAVTDPGARALVDSGRLAEPYWYVDSPLTTPDETRPFPGRPPRGQPPVVVPGVLLPDAPVRLPGGAGTGRLRELVRDGLLVLTTEGVDASVVDAWVGEATDVPRRVLRLADLDPDGSLHAILDARPREAWLIRPDGHIAAVLGDAAPLAVRSAVDRILT